MNIESKAYGLKCTRAEARGVILALARERPELVDTLAPVYACIAPARPKRPATAWGWVASAVNVKDKRPVCHFVYVDHGQARATDGRRLHFAPCDKPEGCYLPDGTRYEGDVPRPPDWRARFPVPPLDGIPEPVERRALTDEVVGVRLPSGQWINALYWDGALALGRPDTLHHGGSPDGRVHLSWADGRGAVLMPLRAAWAERQS